MDQIYKGIIHNSKYIDINSGVDIYLSWNNLKKNSEAINTELLFWYTEVIYYIIFKARNI